MLRDNSVSEINRALLDMRRKADRAIVLNRNVSVSINYYGLMAESYSTQILNNINRLSYFENYIYRLRMGLEINRQELIDAYNSAVADYNSAVQSVNAAKQDISNANTRIKQAKKLHEDLTKDYNTWISNTYVPTLNNYNAHINELEAQKASMQTELARLRAQYQSLQTDKQAFARNAAETITVLTNHRNAVTASSWSYTSTLTSSTFYNPLALSNGIPVGNMYLYSAGDKGGTVISTYEYFTNVTAQNGGTQLYRVRVNIAGSNALAKMQYQERVTTFINDWISELTDAVDNFDERLDELNEEIMSLEENIYDLDDEIEIWTDKVADLNQIKTDKEDEIQAAKDEWDDALVALETAKSSLTAATVRQNEAAWRRNAAKADLDDWNDKYWTYQEGKYQITSDDCPGYSYTPEDEDAETGDE